MTYIQKILQYIDENVIDIGIDNHDIDKRFGVSNSKLQKDFKKSTGNTLREHIIIKKIELAITIRKETPDISSKELMKKINYPYTERSFRNHFTKYSKHHNNPNNDNTPMDRYFFHNKNVFHELLVRLIVLCGFSEPSFEEENKVIIELNVEGTIFQLNGFMPDESIHRYELFYDTNKEDLRYELAIFSQFKPELVRFSNTITPYFNLLQLLDDKLSEEVGFSIKSAILGWDSYIESIEQITFITESYNLGIDLSSKPKLKLDKNSELVKHSNSIIEKIHEHLKSQFENQLSHAFSITYPEFLIYQKHVNNCSYSEMYSFLDGVNINEPLVLDFLLNITDCPYLEHLDLKNYELSFEQNSLEKILSKTKPEVLKTIITYKQTIEELDDEEFYDYDNNEVLNKIIN